MNIAKILKSTYFEEHLQTAALKHWCKKYIQRCNEVGKIEKEAKSLPQQRKSINVAEV